MNPTQLVLVGTRKGAFILRSDTSRQSWEIQGPFFDGWSVYHMACDPRDGALYAAANSDVYGSMIHKSMDGGRTWEALPAAPKYAADSPIPFKRIWHVEPGHPQAPETILAGVEDAGLFRSAQHGAEWEEVQSLSTHETRGNWFPGGGGLCLHTIVLDPRTPERFYIAISAAGTFRTDDGGQSWQPANQGVRADFLPDKYPVVGQCVHKMVLHPKNPDVLYQQNHCGVFRSRDRGEHWEDISAGLPSRFGFPMAVHSQDPTTIYTVPLVADTNRYVPDGSMAVWRSSDGGNRWERLSKGLPQQHAYLTILREGLATDRLNPCGVYVGTLNGQVFASNDDGESWQMLAGFLPPINSISCGSEMVAGG
ncbi:MAG: exo-alpha-sialidase [Chloroflexi bacterium]|nr:exo-alpha-sialidase [Chloroflexota bacterium]